MSNQRANFYYSATLYFFVNVGVMVKWKNSSL